MKNPHSALSILGSVIKIMKKPVKQWMKLNTIMSASREMFSSLYNWTDVWFYFFKWLIAHRCVGLNPITTHKYLRHYSVVLFVVFNPLISLLVKHVVVVAVVEVVVSLSMSLPSGLNPWYPWLCLCLMLRVSLDWLCCLTCVFAGWLCCLTRVFAGWLCCCWLIVLFNMCLCWLIVLMLVDCLTLNMHLSLFVMLLRCLECRVARMGAAAISSREKGSPVRARSQAAKPPR